MGGICKVGNVIVPQIQMDIETLAGKRVERADRDFRCHPECKETVRELCLAHIGSSLDKILVIDVESCFTEGSVEISHPHRVSSSVSSTEDLGHLLNRVENFETLNQRLYVVLLFHKTGKERELDGSKQQGGSFQFIGVPRS